MAIVNESYLLEAGNQQVHHDDVLNKEVDSLQEWSQERTRRARRFT